MERKMPRRKRLLVNSANRRSTRLNHEAYVGVMDLPADAAASSYLIADAMQIGSAMKQRLLEAFSASDRLRDEVVLLDRETRRLRAARVRRDQDPMSSMPAPFDVRFSGN